MANLGIVGGTFNPIHSGHLKMAYTALQGLDRIIFMPSGTSYMKEGVLDSSHRYEMVRLAIASEPLFEISDIEIKRSGNSYTYETLQELRKLYPQDRLFFILGEDSLYQIETWKCPEKIFENAVLFVTGREEVLEGQLVHQELSDVFHTTGTEKDDKDISQRLMQQIQHLKEKYHADIRYFSMEPVPVSSTNLRRILAEHEKAEDEELEMIPRPVLQYIMEHGLYQS